MTDLDQYTILSKWDLENGTEFYVIEEWYAAEKTSPNPFPYSRPRWGFLHETRLHWWGIEDSVTDMQFAVENYLGSREYQYDLATTLSITEWIYDQFTFSTL